MADIGKPHNPRISVIMSVYNGEKYLREAIQSILGQTYTDFEFIIVNDASTDESLQIILGFSDSRIRLIINDTNTGLTKSLNVALEQAKGEFIARQDADDISLPERFQKQLQHYEQHPETALLGTSHYIIDENGIAIGKRVIPADPSRNKFYGSSFAHGSTMFRSEAIRKLGGYNELFRYSQDFDLWLRFARHYQVRGMPEKLYKLRYHRESVQLKRRDEAALYHLLALRIDRNELSEDMLNDIKNNGIKSLHAYLNVSEKVFYHQSMAYVYVRNNDMKLARAEYRKVLKLSPLNINSMLNLILSYLGKWLWTSAHRLYELLRYSY